MIPRNIHGILDYIVGLALIAAPWLFGFADDSAATYVPVILGLGSLLYSLMTRYEAGLIKLIPFKTHLVLDVMAGAFLAASPWLFGFASHVYLPHLIVGLFEVVAGLTTKDSSAPVHHHGGHVRHA
jgi:hypothetical protein